MKLTLYVFLAGLILSGCCRNKSNIIISPLHPYFSGSRVDSINSHNFFVKYYFIKGACQATNDLVPALDSFVNKVISNDITNFTSYGGYYIDFYKESSDINSDYRYTGDDNTLDSHISDLLFSYYWENQKFIKREYYEGGKVIKTDRSPM